MNNSTKGGVNILTYKVSRLGKKLNFTNDPKILAALPKEIPERTWAETLQKEDNDLLIFEIREEIFNEAMNFCYEEYMTRQTTAFTVHCASLAWLKLIDWYFYRHDPGEDPSAYPPCFIPKRASSWEPDDIPDPCPKDTFCEHALTVFEEILEPVIPRWPSSDSLDYPLVQPIPEECKFPGRVELYTPCTCETEDTWLGLTDSSGSRDREETESELLQKVTDYNSLEMSLSPSKGSVAPTPSKVDGSMQGAGDSFISSVKSRSHRKFSKSERTKKLAKIKTSSKLKMKTDFDLDSRSGIERISDCRLRSLRLDTQYEIADEKFDIPPGEKSLLKRK